jgi:uncharacterized membrane protein YgcG
LLALYDYDFVVLFPLQNNQCLPLTTTTAAPYNPPSSTYTYSPTSSPYSPPITIILIASLGLAVLVIVGIFIFVFKRIYPNIGANYASMTSNNIGSPTPTGTRRVEYVDNDVEISRVHHISREYELSVSVDNGSDFGGDYGGSGGDHGGSGGDSGGGGDTGGGDRGGGAD